MGDPETREKRSKTRKTSRLKDKEPEIRDKKPKEEYKRIRLTPRDYWRINDEE